MTDLDRRRLIANLLARPHLIVSGPAGSGKRRFAHELALSMVDFQAEQVRTIQGHPWWASETGDTASYVGIQTEFSTLRLNDFVESIYGVEHASLASRNRGNFVVCVEQLSPAEVNLYFEQFTQWLTWRRRRRSDPAALRLIGTLDSSTAPTLNRALSLSTALVHLEGPSQSQRRTVQTGMSGKAGHSYQASALGAPKGRDTAYG